MVDSRALDCIRKQEQFESGRSIWENHWHECAQRVWPHQDTFNTMRTEGEKRNEYIFDDTAPLALSKFTAAVISMAFPATQRYQKLTVNDDNLANDTEVKRYYDKVVDILFKARYAPRANFQSQSAQAIMGIGAFGTGPLFIDDVPGIGIRYKALPLAQCYIAEDANGMVDTLYRKFQWTAHAAYTKFGDSLPDCVKQAVDKEPGKKFWFIHAVQPNNSKIYGAKNFHGMDYWSAYICMESQSIVDEGGYRTFPFAVPRYEMAPDEAYGRSPAMKVLPSIKTVNEMMKSILRSAQIAVSPPIMLSDDGALQAFNVRPNALNFGYIDDQGRNKAAPFQTNARVDIGLDMIDRIREAINDAFLVTLFRILVDNPQITATEAMLRAQEKGELLAPTMGRIQTELIAPCTARELDILAHAGRLPPMPDKLKQYYMNGGEHQIEYMSPLNLAQKAGAGIAIMNTLQAIAPLAQIDPSVMARFDIDDAAKQLAEINGMPASIIRSDDEVTALKDQQATQQQAQQLLAAAPVAASASKDFAQAASLAGSSPNQVAPNLGLTG